MLLELSQNVQKLTTPRPFSNNFTGCPFMTASTIKFFLPHTCQLMETLLSTSLSSFISTTCQLMETLLSTSLSSFISTTCQMMETLLSTSLSSFIPTPPLALSDRLQDLSLMFLGREILRQNYVIIIVIMYVRFFPNLLGNMHITVCMPMFPVSGVWSEFLWVVLS